MKDENAQPGIRIAQIFVEDATFSHRADPHSLSPTLPQDHGEVNVTFETREAVDGSLAQARLTVESKPDEDALYDFRVALVMVVRVIPGEENLTPIEYAKQFAQPTLVAFTREFIANLTMRGRFGPLWINPINLQAGVRSSSARVMPKASATATKKLSRRASRKATKGRK